MGNNIWVILTVGIFLGSLLVGSNVAENQNETFTGVEEAPISARNVTTSEAKTNTKRTCACDDTVEIPLCANNGVTYKSSCRFDCAKARVTRLRVVRRGPCTQTLGTGSYWQNRNN